MLFRVLGWCLAAAGLAHAEAPAKPNLVILLADDLGWKDVGCYGGPVETPALDGLAAKGVRFTDFYAGAAVCSPSRATLLTGRHHIRSGIYSWIDDHTQDAHLREREVTLAEVLKSHGYATAHFGKWHLGMPTQGRPKPTPDKHGFDHWFATANNAKPSHRNPVNLMRNGERVGNVEGYACQIVVDEAMRWLEKRRQKEKPFFLNVWFHEPHAPIAAPDEIVSKYGALNDPAAIYSGTIENTDRAVGRLLEKLRETDAVENTLIVYASDNGSYRADRVGGLRGKKGGSYEGGIRVPGIFAWPGTIGVRRVTDVPGGLVDVLPTVCGLLGLGKPEGVHLDGVDLSSLLKGGEQGNFKRSKPLFWMLPASSPAIAMRDGDYTLVAERAYPLPRNRERMNALKKRIEETLRRKGTYAKEIHGSTFEAQLFEGFKDVEAERLRGEFVRLNMFQESWIPAIKTGAYQRFRLFDLGRDPGQTKDLATENPEVVERMKGQLAELRASVMAEAP